MSILKRLLRSQLVRGSLLVFIGGNTASFGNFLYNLLMGRFLGSELYGDLGAVFSVLVLISVPLSVLNMSVVKIISSYWGQKDRKKIKGFHSYIIPRLFVAGTVIFLILGLLSNTISGFLKLDNFWPVVIIALYFIFSVSSTANKAVLSGTLSFLYITVNSFIEIGLKLIVSAVLVMLNFSLIGALTGPLVGMIAAYFLSCYEINLILKGIDKSDVKYKPGRIITSSIPFLLVTLALNSMINLDIILVKHFFDGKTAGDYVALSTVGKIIFYVVGPLITVMFPIISSRSKNGMPYILPLFGTIALSSLLNLILVFSYFLFPKAIINILFGGNYSGVIPYMGPFAFFMAIYTIDSTLTYFLISVSYYKPVYLLFLISLCQGVGIFLFHSSVSQVININILISMVYLAFVMYFVLRKEAGTILKVIKLKNF